MERGIPMFSQNMVIEQLSEAANRYIASEWRTLFESMYDQLAAAFAEIEDAAYGLYLDQLMPYLFEQLEDAGFSATEKLEENDFVIGKRLVFRNSLERWGAEDHRSRVFWNVIHDKQGNPIGTLLTEIPHSHLRFDIPSAPVVYALREVLKEQIVQGIRKIKEQG
ncbi:DUF6022 family protein [Paenibacillus sp. GCM10023252]|uniref:DUF6022 family protein n=1 Tax=Paenibacillus sp. GCM10023252 TaxID=3252649 RepID=UPI00361403A5